MTLCPIAAAVGCKACPMFSFCPLKTVIGDEPKAAKPEKDSSVRAEATVTPPRND